MAGAALAAIQQDEPVPLAAGARARDEDDRETGARSTSTSRMLVPRRRSTTSWAAACPDSSRVLLLTVMLGTALVKLGLLLQILTGVRETRGTQCAERNEKLLTICEVVTASLCIFIASRVFLCNRYLRASVERLQQRRSTTWKYLVHFMLFWPLYVYCFTSHEFLAQFRTFQECGYHHPDLYAAFRLFGYCSGLVSMMASFFLIWQVVFIWDTRAHPRHEVVCAPPNLIETLPSVPYSPGNFGDEENKKYPGMCPICLGEWEEDDDIRVPACGHAFHKDCLRRWLQKGTTCAVCRQDVDARPPDRGVDPAAAPGDAPPAPLLLGRQQWRLYAAVRETPGQRREAWG